MIRQSFKMARQETFADDRRFIEPLNESFHEPPPTTQKKKHECAICGFTTDRVFNYKRHLNVHTDIDLHTPATSHLCNHCGKAFASRSGLIRHSKKLHLQTSKYKCEICKQLFTEKSHFQGHMTSHVDQKSFACDSCSMAFQYKPNLLRHKKNCGMMAPKKQHTCDVCGSTFSRKDILKDHMDCKHMKKKTYNCTYCGSQYFWRSSLSKHVSVHHKDE